MAENEILLQILQRLDSLDGQVNALNRRMAVMENTSQKQIQQIADGHKMLAEKMDRMEKKLDSVQNSIDRELVSQEFVIKRMQRAQ